MAYDRYETRPGARDEGSRWSGRDDESRFRADRGRSDERGFFERAGDQISSWFGDDDRSDRGRDEHGRYEHGRDEHGRDEHRRDEHRRQERARFEREAGRRDFERDRNAGEYRPMTGDYGRSQHESGQFFAASGVGRSDRDYDRSQSPWGRDDYRRTSAAGTSQRGSELDPHYHSWRERQVADLDRDYDEYRRENQSRFEREFSSWREQRQAKRGLLGQARESMEVVGNDDIHVGTVDKIAGDRIILAKSDPESGGVHHSLSCSDIGRIEGDRIILDCPADEARTRWRDESRSRALFERDDQGEMGPRMLDRSFEGTYRR